MSNSDKGASLSTFFSASKRVAISSLNPNRSATTGEHIEATIVLLWPYSSSNSKLSLLLAENDVRLRKSKGQVRVTFEGGCAQEVAKIHAGIGDTVKLALQHVSWKETGDAVSTPGKKVNWDLEIRKTVTLEVRRKNEDPIFLSFTATTPTPVPEIDALPITSPRPTRSGLGRVSSALPFTPHVEKHLKASASTHIDVSLSPFAADDDEYSDSGSRKRTKYARHSSSWQLLGSEDSDKSAASDQIPPSTLSPTRLMPGPAISSIEETFENNVDWSGADATGLMAPANWESTKHGPVYLSTGNPEDGYSAKLEATRPSTFVSTEQASTQMLPPLLPDLALPKSTPVPMLQPVVSPRLPLASSTDQADESSSTYFSTMPSSYYDIDMSHGAAKAPILENSVTHPVTYTVDNSSLIAHRAESSVNASTLMGERETIAEDMSSFQRTDTMKSDHVPTVPLEAFDNSDIRGLGDAYSGLPGDIVDLDALQQDMEHHYAMNLNSRESNRQDEHSVGHTRPPAISAEFHAEIPDTSAAEELEPRSQDYGLSSQDLPVSQKYFGQEETSIESSFQKQQRHFDGVSSVYEEEIQRINTRSQDFGLKVASQPVDLVEISSDEDEVMSKVGNNSEIVSEHGVSEAGLDRPETVLGGDEVKLTTSQPSPTALRPEFNHHLYNGVDGSNPINIGSPSLIVTTAATQQITVDEAPLVINHPFSTTDLPSSPHLAPFATDVEDMFQSQGNSVEPDLPKLPVVSDVARPRLSTRRLTRKTFSSDTIGNEYFTPRRSNGAIKLHLDEPTDDFRSEHIPSSPQGQHVPSIGILDRMKVPLASKSENGAVLGIDQRKYTGLSTELSYYPRLCSIIDFYNQEVDIVAVCTASSTEAAKATTGPRDFHTSIRLADASCNDNDNDRVTITAQIFRPRKGALPVCRCGDAILLRNVKVIQQKLMPMLLSTDTSAWAVFSSSSNNELTATVNGPPVEYGEDEVNHIKNLLSWWHTVGEQMFPSLPTSQAEDAISGTVPTTNVESSLPLSVSHIQTLNQAGQNLRDTNAKPSLSEEPPAPTTQSLPPARVTRSQHRRGNSSISNQTGKVVAQNPNADSQPKVRPKTQEPSVIPVSDTTSPSQPTHGTENPPISPAMSTRSMRSTRSHGATVKVHPDATSPMSTAKPTDQTPPGRRKKRNRKKSDPNAAAASLPTEPIQKDDTQLYELRDGTRYADASQGGSQGRTRASKSGGAVVVHELRGGAKYTD